MSAKLAGMAWDRRGVSAEEKVVLLALADMANDDGRFLTDGWQEVAVDCGLPAETVGRILDRFAAAGLVALEAASGGGTLGAFDLAGLESLPLTGAAERRAAP